jgi:hypothetical protein
MTCDSELIVGYLYDELTPAERQRFERHLAACEPCRIEATALRETRSSLAAWAPPAPDLGFEIVQRPAPGRRRLSAFRPSPAWGLAAAAVLVLAAASAIANLEVQVGPQGLIVRTGWQRTEAPAAPAVSANNTGAEPGSAPDVATLSARIGQLESALAARPSLSPEPVAQTVVAPQAAELLRQVRQLIAESEKRQQGELALVVGQVHRDVEAARRSDFARLQQVFAQQGLSDAQVVRWQQLQQLEDRLLRVVQQQQR